MKTIVKTKILSTKEQETSASKKKNRLLTGLAAGLGGTWLSSEQDKWGSRHKKTEEVTTFLIIYDDSSRETEQVVNGSERYNSLIMYLE